MGQSPKSMETKNSGNQKTAADSLFPERTLERQKQTDLSRAMARSSIARPIKKELRHSQIEGRYIRPEEVKKEIEKLEKAKQEAEAKQKGFFSRLFGRKKKPATDQELKDIIESASGKKGDSPDELKQKAEKIRRLRGIALKKKRYEAQEAEERFLSVNGIAPDSLPIEEEMPDNALDPLDTIPWETEAGSDVEENMDEAEKRSSFLQAVHRMKTPQDTVPQEESEEVPSPFVDEAERERALFAPVFSDGPDGMFATALSAAVGFIYWDEDGRRIDRIITIRRLFLKQGDILIDAFCHDIGAPRLISFSRGIRLYNLQTMKAYENPRDFLLHQVTGVAAANNQSNVSGCTMALSVVRYELTALVYAAKSDFNRTDEENKLMLAYISQRCPTIDFDENEMMDYIAMLVPDDQSFYEALEFVVKQSQDIVFLFTRTFLQMMLSDGVLQEKERELLAELLYLLQIKGFDLGRVGLE